MCELPPSGGRDVLNTVCSRYQSSETSAIRSRFPSGDCPAGVSDAVRPDVVIVMNPIYRNEIQATLDGLGLRSVEIESLHAMAKALV